MIWGYHYFWKHPYGFWNVYVFFFEDDFEQVQIRVSKVLTVFFSMSLDFSFAPTIYWVVVSKIFYVHPYLGK